MIRHVALLTLVDDVTEPQVAAIEAALASLPARLPGLRSYSVGRDLGLDEGNASLVVVAEFANRDDYTAYRDDPEHRRIIAELIVPVLAARSGAQYETA